VTVAIGWSGYVVSFLHDCSTSTSRALSSAARGTMVTCPAGRKSRPFSDLPAVIIIGLVTTLLVVGIKNLPTSITLLCSSRVAVVLLFIAFAAHAVNSANLATRSSSTVR